MHLTDRTIAALPFEESGQKLHKDDAIPGFGIRIGAATKVFVLMVGAERQRITIGRYPVVSLAQAREKARTILAKRQLGLDAPPTPFFKETMRDYLHHREDSVRIRTFQKDTYVSKLFARLKDRRLGDITPEGVQAILDDQTSPWTRHYALGFFAGLIRYAQKHGAIDQWPLARLEAPIEHISRERVLTPEELVKVLSLAKVWRLAGCHHFGTIVELLILTGQRRQQIGSLDRSHVDFDAGTLTWPPELMKNNRRHTIPLGSAARGLLDRRVNGLYFPNQHGHPFSAWGVWLKRFNRDLGFNDWTLHDLRRTLATRWQEMGIEIAVTERMLSHSVVTGGLVGIYQRSSYLVQLRDAVQRWEDHLQVLLSKLEEIDGRGNVRDLRTA